MGNEIDTDELKRQVDFEQVVLRDCKKEKDRGSEFTVLCPFHEEDTASMNITPEEGLYNCFGCGAGGDTISWVMKMEGVGFLEAVQLLTERYGIDAELSEEAQSRRKQKRRLRQALEKAIEYYRRAFEEADEAEGARQYMTEERGISPDVLEQFEIGYAPTGRLSLLNQTDWEEREEALLEIGIIDTPRHGGYREKFEGRIIFPIRTHLGKAAGMAGRKDPTQKTPAGDARGKYENTPDSPIYEKKEILYGLHEARKEIRQQDRSIVVEGYTDVLRLHTEGVSNAVASCGTSFSEAQARRLARTSEESVFVFDGDEAGYRSEKRALKETVPTDLQPRAVRLPEGTDPADLADGDESVREIIRQQQKGLVAFLVERARQQGGMERPKGRVSVLDEITDVIKDIEDRILRREYIREAAFELERLGEDIYLEVARKRGEEPTEQARRRFRNIGAGGSRQGQLRDNVSAEQGDDPSNEGDGHQKNAPASGKDRTDSDQTGGDTSGGHASNGEGNGEGSTVHDDEQNLTADGESASDSSAAGEETLGEGHPEESGSTDGEPRKTVAAAKSEDKRSTNGSTGSETSSGDSSPEGAVEDSPESGQSHDPAASGKPVKEEVSQESTNQVESSGQNQAPVSKEESNFSTDGQGKKGREEKTAVDEGPRHRGAEIGEGEKWPVLMSSEEEVVVLARRMAEGVTEEVMNTPENAERIAMTLVLGIGEAGFQLFGREVSPTVLQNRKVREVLEEGRKLSENLQDRKIGLDDLSFANRSNAREEAIRTTRIGEKVEIDPDAIRDNPGGALRGTLVGWKSYWVHQLEQRIGDTSGETDFLKVKTAHRASGVISEEKRRLEKLLNGSRKAVVQQTKFDDLWETVLI